VEDNSYSKNGVMWRCSNRKCNKQTSNREWSWFASTHFLLEQAQKLTYYWVFELPGDFISRELSIGGEHTVVHWKTFARQVCLSVLEADIEQFGGLGKFVEIDESKLGKKKYYKGRGWRGCGFWEE